VPFEKDEWEGWREHPVTMWFMETYLQNEAASAKQAFIDYAWGRREIDPIHHATLYERAQVLDEMRRLDYDDIKEAI
jgi:hypothetical protein